MALFVELDDHDVEQPPAGKPVWRREDQASARATMPVRSWNGRGEAHGRAVWENPNQNSMTEALGCYPIVMAIASSIDLNTLDSLSRTCRQVRAGLLQYRKMLLISTLHCTNESVPVDPDEVLRYRARAGNWFYMEDQGRANYTGKTGRCAKDLVSECRRCGTVVCRNCAIKPPAPIVLRDRHRRLCVACTRAPLGRLVKPRLPATILLSSETMQRAVCQCDSDGVWLCQPCGRTIRADDQEYQTFVCSPHAAPRTRRATHAVNRIWKWRNQYGEVLGGLGTGIGEGDRGAICGRDAECCAAKEREQETDCDAEDAREAEELELELELEPGLASSSTSTPAVLTPGSSAASQAQAQTPLVPPWQLGMAPRGTPSPARRSPEATAVLATSNNRRTPSPALLLGPGYARHEIEGIGGVVKKKRVKMVRVGACVPEWEDEKARREVLGREVRGQVRSWCGWCRRVIPGKTDWDREADVLRERERDSAGSSESG